MRTTYRRGDFERLERGRYAQGACPRCASTRVHYRMQPRIIVHGIPGLLRTWFKGYRLGWSCEFCGNVWFEP
jgi:hypothetical protein